MPSLTIRNLSLDTKAILQEQAKSSERSLEAHVRSLLDQAAETTPESQTKTFPYDLIALVEPGKDIDPFIEEHDQEQAILKL